MRSIVAVILLCVICPLGSAVLCEPSVHVCTVASHDKKSFRWFLHSCNAHDIVPDVLGFDMPYPSHTWRLVLMERYLQTLPDEDIVLFVDAYDLFFVGGQEEAAEKFLAMDTPILFSAERNCHPARLKLYCPELSGRSFRHLCAGTYIGYVWRIKEMLASLKHPFPQGCDQGFLMKLHLVDPRAYPLDQECAIALPLFTVNPDEVAVDIETRRVECLETGTHPCILHGNGPNKRLYQELFETLYPEAIAPKQLEDYQFRRIRI